MRRGFNRTGSERGDTLVEVMIVLAVLGLAIGISYATANRSLLQAREAQENSQAVHRLEQQVELIRSLAPVVAPPVNKDIFHSSWASTPFCVDLATTTLVVDTNPACRLDTFYNISITRAADDTFSLTAVWANVQGEGNDAVTLSYRLHKS